jgi:5,10-methylenetetrahydrofolate reductase
VSRLRDALDAGRFVVTGEVAPPLGTDTSAMEKSAALLSEVCIALNVTDNQGATLHMASLAASKRLLDLGHEPIFQQTCRDRNRLALQSDLLAAASLGIENLLVVTGDDPRSGDYPEAKGVFDIDSTQLLQMATAMNEGRDAHDRELKGGTGFLLGGALFPEAEPWDIQVMKADKKVAAGARFFQTQAVFDMDKLARATEAMHEVGAKVLAGILLLRSPRVVAFINERLAGLEVPDHIAARIAAAADPAAEAVELAVEQATACREICDGVHIMPLGLEATVPDIVRRAGIATDQRP